MKKKALFMLLFNLVVCGVYAQNTINKLNIKTVEDSLFSEFTDDIKLKKKDSDKINLVSSKTLDKIFTIKTSIYLSEASDLSLSKAYAVLDNSDGRLFLGSTFNLKKSNETFNHNLWTAGVKTNVVEGFSNLFDSKSFKNDIGLSLKYTWLGYGILDYSKPEDISDKVKKKRNRIKSELLYKFKKDLGDFIEQNKDIDSLMNSINTLILMKSMSVDDYTNLIKIIEFKTVIDSLKIKSNMTLVSLLNLKESVEAINSPSFKESLKLVDTLKIKKAIKPGEFLKIYEPLKALKEFYEETEKDLKNSFFSEEAENVIDKKLFNYVYDRWFGFDLYVPVTHSTYNVAKDNKTDLSKEYYRPFELSINYNLFREDNIKKFPFKGTKLLTLKATAMMNNSVNSNLIQASSMEDYYKRGAIGDSVLLLTKTKSESVYIGKFEQFITYKLSARYVYMPFPFIGFSASLEKTFGTQDNLNWRLGIPVSLKGKDEKSKVNFELVWKEVNKEHSVGLSIGLPIGNTNVFGN